MREGAVNGAAAVYLNATIITTRFAADRVTVHYGWKYFYISTAS
jgi:hypothetical protein